MVRLGSGVLRSARTRGLRVLVGAGVRVAGETVAVGGGAVGVEDGCGMGVHVDVGTAVGVGVGSAVGVAVGTGVAVVTGGAGFSGSRRGSASGGSAGAAPIGETGGPPGFSAPSAVIVSSARMTPGTGRSVDIAIPFVCAAFALPCVPRSAIMLTKNPLP